MKKAIIVLLALAGAAFAAPYKFTALPKSTAVTYWNSVQAGIEKARKELKAQGVDVEVTWVGPESEEQVDRQIELLRAAVAKKTQGLILAPCDSRQLAGPVLEAQQAGVPTVVIDSGLKSTSQISFIATDNYKGGVLGAKRLGALLGGKGRVVLFRAQRGSGATESREAGFLETIKSQFPGIKVVSADQYSGGSYSSAEKAATELIQKFGGETEGVFASNDIASHGVIEALKKAGLGAGKVKVVGFDASAGTIAAIRSGDLQGTIVQNPMQMGYLAVKALVDKLKGNAVEKDIDTGCVLVTPDNIDKPAVAELIKN